MAFLGLHTESMVSLGLYVVSVALRVGRGPVQRVGVDVRLKLFLLRLRGERTRLQVQPNSRCITVYNVI